MILKQILMDSGYFLIILQIVLDQSTVKKVWQCKKQVKRCVKFKTLGNPAGFNVGRGVMNP